MSQMCLSDFVLNVLFIQLLVRMDLYRVSSQWTFCFEAHFVLFYY